MNSGWGGGGMNPPEPLPMGGGKGLRDGYLGGMSSSGGMPSSGRQITKNPMNMLGGLGTSSVGGYTNGSSSGSNSSFGFGEPRPPGPIGERGSSIRDQVGPTRDSMMDRGGSMGERGGSMAERGGPMEHRGGSMGMSMMNKMNQPASSSSNGNGYTQDGYGMGAMGRQGRRSPPTSSSGFNNGFSSGMNGLGERNMGSSNLSGMGDRGGLGGFDRGMGSMLDRGLERSISDRGIGGMDRGMNGPVMDRGMERGMDRGMNGHGLDRGMPGSGLDRGMPGSGLDRGMSGSGIDRGMPGSGLDRGIPRSGLDRGMSGPGLDRGMNGPGFDRGMSMTGMDRGMSSSGMDRGISSSGMDRGINSSGMDRGMSSSGMDRGMSSSGMDRGMSSSGMDRGMSSSGMDRGMSSSGMDRGLSSSGLERSMGGMDLGMDRPMFPDGGGGLRDMQETRDQREFREKREFLEMRERMHNRGGGMMGGREMTRSTSEIGPDRGMLGMDRGMPPMGRDMLSSGDMMGRNIMGSGGGNRDFMRSNSEMIGMRSNDQMGMDRMDRGMGSRMDSMDHRGDSGMMSQRSMSMSNGGGGYGMGADSSGFNRSMSHHGGPPSPPGGNDMKIGTWNDAGNTGSNPAAGNMPAMTNFEIGTFNINDPGSRSFASGYGGSHVNGTTQSNLGPIQPGMGIRETGIIEKLLHSYGFIQCCDRQARLFFHFSQFEGNIEHLKIGDPVEFEMTYDRRTGKPIASAVSKIAPEVVMSEERVIGTVTTEIKINPESGNETQGRISYENRGECFFLPFNTTDVEGNVTLVSGDKVSFQMATVQRNGNLAAKTIRLENPAAPVKYRGVVNSLKEAFGFIERADVVKEIFFHITDMVDGVKEDNSSIQLGDDVEFIIQTRNGKEVACQLTKLVSGTVVFEDVGIEFFRGQVLKPLDRAGKYQQTDALPGRVKYRAADRSEAEIPFGEKDQLGDFTLRHGDWIKFIVATDRRDKLKRATKIELLDESFQVSDERREQGLVLTMKEGFGFLQCVDRTEKIFFHFSECLDVSRNLAINDEVEFTVAADPTQLGRQLATRIKHLATGSVKFDIIIAQNILGLVAEEPSAVSWSPRSPSKAGDSPAKEGAGRVVYELNGLQLSIPLYAGDCDLRSTPKVGDKVQFNINQLKSTKETNAVNVRILERANVEPIPPPTPLAVESEPKATPEPEEESPPRERKENTRLGTPQRGYVAALKDGFGFIETLQHDKEIFFHFSNVEGKAEKLEVGQEVEYSIYSREKGGKVSAEGVKPLPKGTIPKTPCKDETFYGKVVRPLRSVNPDQVFFEYLFIFSISSKLTDNYIVQCIKIYNLTFLR